MGSSRLLGGCVTIALLAACAGAKSGQVANANPADSLPGIGFKEVTERILHEDPKESKCPVTLRFEAVLLVSHMDGKMTYRWEHSDGSAGTTGETDIPGAAHAGTAEVKAVPDDWTDAKPGALLMLTDRLHLLSPVDKVSPPVDIQVRCL
jgi:hypothetical protein